MAPLQLTVHAWSRSNHAAQIYLGLALLESAGETRIEWRPEQHPALTGTELRHRDRTVVHGVAVTVVDGPLVWFDTRDHAEWHRDVAQLVDLYAKRSFVPPAVLGAAGSLVPLGLNMPFGINRPTVSDLARELQRRRTQRRTHGAIHRLAPRDLGARAPRPDAEPSVVFLARLWDPDDPEVAGQHEVQLDRRRINEMRAQCVRQLRAAFGPRCVSGVARSEFALRHFGDVVVADERMTKRARFQRTLDRHPIAVATAGLHGSNGWKLAEYVSTSKAIVAERTDRLIPGGFGPDTNYLEFDDADGCVAAVERLLIDRATRVALMEANWDHWNQWLRPDRLVKRVLARALD